MHSRLNWKRIMLKEVEEKKRETIAQLMRMVKDLALAGSEELKRKVELLDHSLDTLRETISRQKTKDSKIAQALMRQQNGIAMIKGRIQEFEEEGKPLNVPEILASLDVMHTESAVVQAVQKPVVVPHKSKKRRFWSRAAA